MNSSRNSVLIVEAKFYPEISIDLADGAISVLEAKGFSFERVEVPGIFEIPQATKMFWDSGNFCGSISLGCVIRGETDHYDHICREVSRKLMDLALELKIPYGFGLITCENIKQAKVRADKKQKNVGGRAAEACATMIRLETESH